MPSNSPFEIELTGSITKNGQPFCDATIKYFNCNYEDVLLVESGIAKFQETMIKAGKERPEK